MKAIINSFPIRILQVHLKHNPFLLLYWFLLFAVVNGSFGSGLGIPYLFLDPVYLNEVNWLGFMILGVTLCGFTMAFNITGYILDSYRFRFLGNISRPFTHYCLNNSIIPIIFLFYHAWCIFQFQTKVELNSAAEAFGGIGGLLLGYGLMLALLLSYFMNTNRDFNKQLEYRRKRKDKPRTGKSAFRRLRRLKRGRVDVGSYIGLNLKPKPAVSPAMNYNRMVILNVFKQNQRNAIRVQGVIVLVIILLGAFQGSAVFQIPAAASGVILLTIIVMITAALSFWFRSWLLSVGFIIFLVLNLIFRLDFLSYEYPAFGLSYEGQRKEYSQQTVKENAAPDKIEASKLHMLQVLENWKEKTGEEKPVMVLVTVSGGGQRSALWSLNVLQQADSVTGNNLMNQTALITGASGGLFGAAYYRDLFMHGKNRNAPERLRELGNEVLNPVIFTLLVNDLLPKVKGFEYAGQQYKRERGYEFEERMKRNLNGMLDHPLSYYEQPEASGQIPLLMVSPTITNDGRKLYISPQPTAFFNLGLEEEVTKVQGIDFRSFLENKQPDSLRFLTALRMSATFPYITPTISLPTSPAIQIADAGISDNYGLSDATIFLKVFREWIMENTEKVVVLAIRDSPKDIEIETAKPNNLLEKFFSPIQGVYRSWDQIQTIKNVQRFDLLKTLYQDHLHRVDFTYVGGDTRASLSWRLTEREKRDVLDAIHNEANRKALLRFFSLLKATQSGE